jgi:hypothetical protein
MAVNAATVWEVRSTGSQNNGGGYFAAGGASTDYSQQDAAQASQQIWHILLVQQH